MRKTMPLGGVIAGVLAAIVLLALGRGPASAKEIVVAVPGIPGPYCAYCAEKLLFDLK
jgi:hypothetical protein